jgi:hypothetical protein
MASATKTPPRPGKNDEAEKRRQRRQQWRDNYEAERAEASARLTAALAELEAAQAPLKQYGDFELLDAPQKRRLVAARAQVGETRLLEERAGGGWAQKLREDLSSSELEAVASFRREFNSKRDQLDVKTTAPADRWRAHAAMQRVLAPADAALAKSQYAAADAEVRRLLAVSTAILDALLATQTVELSPDPRGMLREMRAKIAEVEGRDYDAA